MESPLFAFFTLLPAQSRTSHEPNDTEPCLIRTSSSRDSVYQQAEKAYKVMEKFFLEDRAC